MTSLNKFLLLILLTCGISEVNAQDTLASVLRPRIGLGTGTFAYYGEVQSYQRGFTPIVNRIGGIVYVNAPATKWLNVEFSAQYGKVASNERTLTRNLNFESRIRMASLYLYYNFYPFFSSKRSIYHPYIGLGFSSFEFLSKTDMYDASGNMYYYWSDGSIMNMDENDPLAATNAIALQRDYTYETDLREQDLDSLGDYREQSFAFPFQFGMEFHLSPRWDFRIATTWHLTLTDLIDNISPAGTGVRKGDKSKDRLWMNYVSLSYDLQFAKPQENMLSDEDTPMYADWDPSDWDHDGVIDALDSCPGTPLEALVDEKGCPLDTDGDFVPDYMDDEPNTPAGNYVDQWGVTITEEDIAKHWREYNDSTGYEHEFAEEKTIVRFGKEGETSGTDPYANVAGKSYVIIVGKEHKDVSANELHKYLGFNDYQTIMKGDTVYYVLGEFTKIEDAVAAVTGLQGEGVDVELIGKNNNNTETMAPVDTAVINKVENYNAENGTDIPEFGLNKTFFRVQIGAFKNKVDPEKQFKGVENLTYGTGEDGITRYYSGTFESCEEAMAWVKTMKGKGYKTAFMVAYKGAHRITLKEAGVDDGCLPTNYDEDKELTTFVEPRDTSNTGTQGTNNSNGIDMTKVKYRVKLAYFEGPVPLESVNVLTNIGGIKPVKSGEATTYYSKKFDSLEDAKNAMLDYQSYGLDDMTPMIEYEGKFYTESEFEAFKNQQ